MTEKSNQCASITTALMAITRTTLIAYVVLAVFSLLESQALLKGSKEGQDGYQIIEKTLLLPLVLCVPQSLSIDGTTITGDVSNGAAVCHELNYLINACAASVLFAAVATVLFLVIDCSEKCGFRVFNKSSVVGMGFFLIFILIQAGISTGALLEQIKFWIKYYDRLVAGSDGNTGIEKVDSYANQKILLSTSILSFAAACLVFLDAMVYRCCHESGAEYEDELAQQKALQAMNQQHRAIERVAGSTAAYNSGTTNLSNGKNSLTGGSNPLWAQPSHPSTDEELAHTNLSSSISSTTSESDSPGKSSWSGPSNTPDWARDA